MSKLEILKPCKYYEGPAECGNGWNWILNEFFAKLCKLDYLDEMNFQIVQIKEKWGGLRIYANSTTDEIDKLIEAAELQALCTCEACGDEGNRNKDMHIQTLCDSCRAKFRMQLEEQETNKMNKRIKKGVL